MPRLTVTVEYEADYDSYINQDDIDDYLSDTLNIDNLKKIKKVKINNLKNRKLGKTIFRNVAN
jgi:hypothetical protein|tara:strand:- start:193 stop:381 length:189 start_codon:yes stop_codon:yes gene_type:complete